MLQVNPIFLFLKQCSVVYLNLIEMPICFQGLATLDGEGMNEFKTDPVKNVLHILAMENRKGGPQIAQKVYDYYFSSAKTDEDIISQYGEVCAHV